MERQRAVTLPSYASPPFIIALIIQFRIKACYVHIEAKNKGTRKVRNFHAIVFFTLIRKV